MKDLDQRPRELAELEVAAALGRGSRSRCGLGVRIGRVLGFADGVVELLLQVGLTGEQISECELQLARPAALCPVAVQPAHQVRVLVRQVGDHVLQ